MVLLALLSLLLGAAAADRVPADLRGLDPALLDRAIEARDCALADGRAEGRKARRVLAVIDYRLPSAEPRLWVLDLRRGRVRFVERVAHGKASGEAMATAFSNVPDSNRSSLGLFRGAETYRGRNGRSLRLDGLDAGVNDRARERAIVIHGAEYATAAFVAANGRLGRSLGCPAVDPAVARPLIRALRSGALVYAWADDPEWQASAAFTSCHGPAPPDPAPATDQ